MKWFFMLLLLPFLLAAVALLTNRAPLLEPPGLATRLKLYLTNNAAQTRIDHVRSELRPLRLTGAEQAVRASVISAMRQLHWTDIKQEQGRLHAVVTTRWLRFKDDIEVHLERLESDILVQVKSTSRLGRGDLAANTRHILDLYEVLEMDQTSLSN